MHATAPSHHRRLNQTNVDCDWLRQEPHSSADAAGHDAEPPRRRPSNWLLVRVLLMLSLAAMPILAISAHVFGIASQGTLGGAMVALIAALATIVTVSPHRIDVVFGRGLIAGMVACAVYDGVRLFAVHVLGWMGDFIPVMGTWVTSDPDIETGAVIGYLWRYLGDGGGLGVAFYLVALAVGLDRCRPHRVVMAATGFAVFPVWSGLIATVALAPHGEELMFPLTPTTLATTLIGHLVFGFVLGLIFVGAQRGSEAGQWPWPPLGPALSLGARYTRWAPRQHGDPARRTLADPPAIGSAGADTPQLVGRRVASLAPSGITGVIRG